MKAFSAFCARCRKKVKKAERIIRYFDMFAGVGGFRAGLDLAGGFPVYRALRDRQICRRQLSRHPRARKGGTSTIPTQEPLTPKNSQTSTSCAEDSPARRFLQLAGGKDLKMQEALSSLNWPEWLKRNDRRIFCLKTCLGSFRMTEAGRLVSSSPRFMTWGIMSNGLCLTANILESRNQDGGCSLSDILIPDAPEKYFLSSAQVEKLLYKSSEARKDPVSTTQSGLACTQTAGAGGVGGKNRIVYHSAGQTLCGSMRRGGETNGGRPLPHCPLWSDNAV